MANPNDPVRVHVDFNDLGADGRFFVLPDDAAARLVLNSEVRLYDAEGNEARGTVVELPDGGAVVAMIPGTWHPNTAPQPVAQGNVAQQVCALVASTLKARHPGAWYQLTAVPAGTLGITAPPSVGVFGMTASASALPRSEGAVLSSL
jgi:hypothetical protein